MKKFYQLASIAMVLLLSQSVQAQVTCEKYGLIDLGEFKIQNNIWGADTAQCVQSTGGTGFTVTVSDHNQSNVASYPAIFKGCHWAECTSNSGMPVLTSSISSANISWTVSDVRPPGVYNVAAEAWLKADPIPDAQNGYGGGAEVMIALDYHWEGSNKFYPAGRNLGTFGAYDVFFRKIGGPNGWEFWTYVPTPPPERQGDDAQYVNSGINFVSDNMLDFINDAKSRSGRPEAFTYLHVMEAGFEIMSGGVGLTSNSFAFDVTVGGPQPPAVPSSLIAAAVTSGQIDLTWSDNSNNENGFAIERKTGVGGTYAEVATVGANVTGYQDTGLAPLTTYFYRVLAFNSGGDSSYSNEDSATTLDGGGGGTLFVDAIVVEWVAAGGPHNQGLTTVVIKDDVGIPVSGATVIGTFSGTLFESVSGTTNSAGEAVILTTGKTRNPDSLMFCVDSVTHASLTYDWASNVETCDSY